MKAITEENKDKLKHSLRFGVLLIACLSMFCDYYIIDIPALLKTELVQYFEPKYGEEQSEIMFSFMYSFYNVPNIILPLFGGILCDQIGYRVMTVVFIAFITVGQIVTSIGLEINNFWCMVIGRLIFGIGGESLNISIQALIIKWFKGSELSFAQALNLSLMRLANVLNNYLTPRIAEYKNMNFSFGFGVCICFMSLFMAVIMVFLDRLFDKKEIEQEKKENEESQSVFSYFKDILVQIKTNITKFNKLFWCISILCVFLYIAVITFNTFSSTIIIDMWLPKENSLQRNQEIAGELMSIPYIIGSFLFPLFGLLTDKIGQRVNLLVLAPLILITSFLLLPVVYPTVTFCLLGLAYAIFGSVIWPTIAYVVPEDKIGIGYGIINAVQNAGMGLFPLLIAFVELKGSSIYVVICFTVVSSISLLFSLVLKYLDSKRDVSLNDSNQAKLMEYLDIQSQNNQPQYQKLPQQQENNNQNVY